MSVILFFVIYSIFKMIHRSYTSIIVNNISISNFYVIVAHTVYDIAHTNNFLNLSQLLFFC